MEIKQPVLEGILYSFVREMDGCTEEGCLLMDTQNGINKVYEAMDELGFEERIAATLKVYGVEATFGNRIGFITVRPRAQYRDCGRKATLEIYCGKPFEKEIDGITTLLSRPNISLLKLKKTVNTNPYTASYY